MANGANGGPVWILESPRGTLQCDALEAAVDVSHPEHGVEVSVHGRHIEGRLLSTSMACGTFVGWHGALANAYVRGADLVAQYERTPDWPFASQIYWRTEAPIDENEFSSLSLLVSVQTHLLDTRPELSVTSHFAADEVLHVTLPAHGPAVVRSLQGETAAKTFTANPSEACCIIWRLARGAMSYAEMAPESDFRQLTVTRRPEGTHAQWELFAEFLEKGVIRKARVHSTFLTRKNDLQLAQSWIQQMQQQPLPLTT